MHRRPILKHTFIHKLLFFINAFTLSFHCNPNVAWVATAPDAKIKNLRGWDLLLLKEFSLQRLKDFERTYQYLHQFFHVSLQAADSDSRTALLREALELALAVDSVAQFQETALVWLQEDPSALEPNIILLITYLSKGHSEKATTYLLNTIHLSQDNGHLEILSIYENMDPASRRELLNLFDQLLKTTTADPFLYCCAAQLALFRDDTEQAHHWITLALKYKADFEQALILKAQLMRKKDDALALSFLKSVLSSSKANDLEALRLFYAAVLIDNHAYSLAEAQLNAIKNEKSLLQKDWLLVQLFLQNKKTASVKQLLSRLVQHPDSRDMAFWHLAELALSAGQKEEALGYLLQVTAPDHRVKACLQAVQILMESQQYPAALEVLQSIEPRNNEEIKELILLQTDILLLNHEPAKAFNNLNDWIKHLSADLDFLYARSTVAEALQESPATELDSTLHRANDLALIYHLGWTNYQQGKYPESLAWFHQFFEASREPLGFARYAELLWVTGNAQKAQEILNNGLEKYPNDPSLIQVQNKIKNTGF